MNYEEKYTGSYLLYQTNVEQTAIHQAYTTEDIYDEILTYIRGEMDYLSEDCSCDNWDDCNDCDNIYCRGKDE